MSSVPPSPVAPLRRAFLRRAALMVAWAERHGAGNWAVGAWLVVMLGMGWFTYVAMSGPTPLASNTNKLILLLNVDLVLLLGLVGMVTKRVVRLWRVRTASRLQARLVGVFSMLVAFPALLTTVFSVGLFYYGIHGWFDVRVRTAVDESLAVAQAYLNEHQQVLKADVQGMATDLSRDSLVLSNNPKALEKMLHTQSFLRNFAEVILFDQNRKVIGQSGFGYVLSFEPVPDEMLDRARAGEVIVEKAEEDDSLRALLRLSGYGDEVYLYAARSVDPKVLAHLDTTRTAVSKYQELEGRSARIQLTITLLYMALVLFLLSAAIWFGLVLSRRMIEPISAVITAAERLRAGDMSARVGQTEGLDEFVTLGRAFDRMTEEIELQRNELIDANRRLDYRRKFTETVLGGVSTGIMGVDGQGKITLANPSAGRLLGSTNDKLIGAQLDGVLPGALEGESATKSGEREIQVLRRDGARRRFLVRASSALLEDSGRTTVLAFDDITELVAVQKSAAWADVARRIAHEIKNPLTPIQLSAERIKRKYLGHMPADKDREILSRCTDTIVKHVDDIKTMVNAFSDFAKMPEPVMAGVELKALVEDVLALQGAAHTGVDMRLWAEADAHFDVQGDEQLIRQALTNLLKNAIEAAPDEAKARVGVRLFADGAGVWLCVMDDGPGIPPAKRDSVLEPYVTTKLKGTGLGLAIVRKIIEDHGGRLSMVPPQASDDLMALYKGAHIALYFPLG